VYAHGSVSSGLITLNHNNGHYQTATITADTTFSFLNFPTGSMGRIILDITVSVGATNLTFPSAVIKADNVQAVMEHQITITPGLGRALFEFVTGWWHD
jgi:hypothetical protein